VAGTIVEWTQQEEAKYQAAMLAAEVEELLNVKKPKPDEIPAEKSKKGRTAAARSPKPDSRYMLLSSAV